MLSWFDVIMQHLCELFKLPIETQNAEQTLGELETKDVKTES
jgi:hypothetical protein